MHECEKRERESEEKSRCHTNSSLATVEKDSLLSLLPAKGKGGRQNEQEGSVSIEAGGVWRPPPSASTGMRASVRGRCQRLRHLPAVIARTQGLCKQEQEAKELKASRLSSLFCCSPRGGSSDRTNGFVLHCLGTAGSVLSVVAVSERGCHQRAHAHGERGKSRRLRRRGLHVAHAILARTVHVHGARAVR